MEEGGKFDKVKEQLDEINAMLDDLPTKEDYAVWFGAFPTAAIIFVLTLPSIVAMIVSIWL